MHNGLMKTGDAKMSKSKGNEIVVAEVLKRHSPEVLRFLLLSTHYRRPIDYSKERLEEIARGLEGFYRLFERYQRITGSSFFDLQAPTTRQTVENKGDLSEFQSDVARLRDGFLEHMDDDFNTGGAIGVLFEMVTVLNRFADSRQLEVSKHDHSVVGDFKRGAVVLKEMTQVLGIFREPLSTKSSGDDQLVAGLMQLLIDLRGDARKAKNFAVADQIRQRLWQLGVSLEDRPGGSDWRLG